MSGAVFKVTRTEFKHRYPNLFLPDGRRADSLNRFELAVALKALGLDVRDDTPHAELLAVYDASDEAKAESVRRKEAK
jgi:hypothetical protein